MPAGKNDPQKPKFPRDAAKKTPRILVWLGTAAILLVPTAFTGIGWQTLRLECVREATGAAPACTVQNGYFFGLFETAPRSMRNISYVDEGSSLVLESGGIRVPISTVRVGGANGNIPVFEMSSNVNEELKRDIMRQVEGFLENQSIPALRIQTWFSNAFGWIGLPLFLIVAPAFLYSIFWYARRSLRRSGERPPSG